VHHLGATRTTVRPDHLLHTPDAFIRTPLPGARGVEFVLHASPRIGAHFAQMTAEFAQDGVLGNTPAQRFVYVLEGTLLLTVEGATHELTAASFAYIPQGAPHVLRAVTAARAAIIEKSYAPEAGAPAPQVVVGNESSITPIALMGDEGLRVCNLMPDGPAYDFAVNTMTYDPGAALAMVEAHIMEHGLLMLEGGGIYRLGDAWYPVAAGDFIWMAPWCPQWFGAIGKQPAKYLIYKDWRRHPLGA
jgi:(S)-ureidoglycine aminohydrolase